MHKGLALRAALDEHRERAGGSEPLDEQASDAVTGLGDARPRGPRETGLDLVAVEPPGRDLSHELRDLGLLESEHRHVEIALLR